MKINPNLPFLKSEMAAPVATTGKSNTAAGVPATGAPVVASPTRLRPTQGDFDAARVADIRESIRAGSYRIDSTKIADGLLSTVRDLIGKNSS